MEILDKEGLYQEMLENDLILLRSQENKLLHLLKSIYHLSNFNQIISKNNFEMLYYFEEIDICVFVNDYLPNTTSNDIFEVNLFASKYLRLIEESKKRIKYSQHRLDELKST